ncbi:hypothetical protein ESB00_16165 [Oleiharenicola lentus]|jgi:hypothetical protein|uniref:Uncharacterized protein n=1 Tax=Oleiharenicola lentus TaxID=2508720 RepID=A0A4Q1C4C2_9BACT|nr:hypothetical protein [Oleiharenicola lentus]RXK53232.1 hypothetical protein ESB00_16165 [Oleiharenicola lentus]
MKPLQQVIFAAGLLILGGITWLILTRPKPQALWLMLEAPSRIAPGETVTIRAMPNGISRDRKLTLDLHGTTARHQSLRVVSHGRSQVIGPAGQVIEFLLTVPARPDLATVHAIVYVSPDGAWAHRSHVAKSEPIPVEVGPATDRELRPLHVHDHTPDPEVPRVELPALRGLLVMLWLIVAGALAVRFLNHSEKNGRGRSLALITASLAIAGSEIFRFEPYASELARQFARKYGFYDGRLLPQQIAIVVTVVVVASLAAFILFKARNRRLVLGLLGHAAIATAAILSLHEMDALLFATLGGAPIEQLAKMSTVSLALWGLRPLVTSPAPGAA